jgi:hypothetical protein
MKNGIISPLRRRSIASCAFGLQINTKQPTPFKVPETFAA